MNIQTYDVTVILIDDRIITYLSVSRVAAMRYIRYHRDAHRIITRKTAI